MKDTSRPDKDSKPDRPEPDLQFKAYEVGAKVYDHIIALQTGVVTVANFFLAITGAIWVAVSTDQLKLPSFASTAILYFHMIGTVATLQIIVSNFMRLDYGSHFLRGSAVSTIQTL